MDHALPADPCIVGAWIKGWTLARGTAAPVPEHEGYRVDVGWPEQKTRYVFPALSERLLQLAHSITEPWVFLKACVPPEAMNSVLPDRWSIQPQGYLMTCSGPMAALGNTVLSPAYRPDFREQAPVGIARIWTEDGTEAAIGRMVLSGPFIIYDRIEVHPGHRRRGLGSYLMKALEQAGNAQGRRSGILVATQEGRALYESLGWKLHSLYTTAVIPAH